MQEVENNSSLNELFLGENQEEVISFIKRLYKLVPFNKPDKIRYLENLIMYVEGLINGDDIREYTTYKYLTKYAKEGLSEIIKDAQENTLSSFRCDKANLEREIEELKQELEELKQESDASREEVRELEEDKITLKDKCYALKGELFVTSKALDDARKNGMQKVEDEVREHRDALVSEIETLTSTKEALNESITKLREMLNEYNLIVSNIQKDDSIVEWVPVRAEDPIYLQNAKSIANFVESLKLEYMDKMHTSEEETDREFKKNAGMLDDFVEILEKFIHEIKDCTSVSNLLNSKGWDSKGKYDISKLEIALQTIKLPYYKKLGNNIDTISVTSESVPSNVNGLLRELHFQRIAVEAVAKQKILEAELQGVIGILCKVAPNVEYESLLSQYDKMGEVLTEP